MEQELLKPPKKKLVKYGNFSIRRIIINSNNNKILFKGKIGSYFSLKQHYCNLKKIKIKINATFSPLYNSQDFKIG